jgi:putative addiction module component (TIGR02574 family)
MISDPDDADKDQPRMSQMNTMVAEPQRHQDTKDRSQTTLTMELRIVWPNHAVDWQLFLNQFPPMTLANFPQLERLPPRQRLKLAEQLWDSAASDSLAVPASHKRLIRSRRKAYEQGQIATFTMDELKKSVRRRK